MFFKKLQMNDKIINKAIEGRRTQPLFLRYIDECKKEYGGYE